MLHAEPSCLSWLICIGDTFRQDRAFSSEVGPGSRKENASKQEARAPFRFNRNGKGSSRKSRRNRGSVPCRQSVACRQMAFIICFHPPLHSCSHANASFAASVASP